MRKLTLGIAIGGGLLLALGRPLDAAAQHSGEAWNDHHKQSNAARLADPAPPRPPIQGTTRFEQSASNPTEAPPTTVPETTLEISQHEWTQGGAASVSRGSSQDGRSTFGGISGRANPSVSSGIQRSSTARSSSLRSSSQRGRGARR
jgi:hypothetical protein